MADPAAAPGTGTPEPGGLSARELLDAVRRICLETNVVGMDVVEVAPAYDHADITAVPANRVNLEALSALAQAATDLLNSLVFHLSAQYFKIAVPIAQHFGTGHSLAGKLLQWNIDDLIA